MVVGVVAVLAALEQRAEFDRLVRLVMVHRPHVEPGHTQREADGQCGRYRGRSRTRGSFRQTEDLDLDVVIQVVRRVPLRVEPDIPAFRALRVEQLALGHLDVLLVLPQRDL